MQCHICKQEVNKLIAPGENSKDGVLYGPCCFQNRSRGQGFDYTLNQTLDKWTHRDKKRDVEISHRLTKGKTWEIENRKISPDDNRSVINIKTGKPAQY